MRMNFVAFLVFSALSVHALRLAPDERGIIQSATHLADRVEHQLSSSELGSNVVPELTRNDFKGISFQVHTSPMIAKVAYVVINAVVLLIIAALYYDRGLPTVIAIMALVLSLSCMSNTIQGVYAHGFPYATFITACHQLCSSFVAFSILQCKRIITGQQITYPSLTTVMTGLGPVSLLFAASLGFSNLALLYSNTHFYEMLTPASPLATFIISVALGNQKSMKVLPPLLLITVALPLVALGEVNMSVPGLVFALGAVFFRAGKASLNSMLMSAGTMSQTFHPVELTCWTTSLTFIVMILWSLVQDGLEPYKAICDTGVVTAVLISCVCASVLNISVLLVMKDIGPVAQQILGELKGTLACVGAVAAFGEVITLQEAVGYAVAFLGIVWYNHASKLAQEEEVKATN